MSGDEALKRRSIKASPEVLTPYGWMSLPHVGPYDDASLLALAKKRFEREDNYFEPDATPSSPELPREKP